MKYASLALLVFASLCCEAKAQPTIFVVRHAEKATSGGKDPDLSEAGRSRAEALAKMLRDAKITAIYATEFKRTQQTAAPLAQALGIQVTIMPATTATSALMEKIAASSGNVLVVGHGDTIPSLIKSLGLSEPISIGENDYDNLFVIVPGEPPHLIRLHFP
jgi:broad specificity phosphatase PhoE